jgi:DNA-binding CsgD family transcriptional regulator
VLGWSLCNLGRVAEGLAHLERAQHLASAEEDIPTLLWTRGQLADGLLATGRAAAAIDAASGILDLGRALGAEAAYGPCSAARGIEAMIQLGDWAAAQQLIGRLLNLESPGSVAAFPRLASGLLRLWQGELAEARADLAQALHYSEQAMVPEAASVGHARLARVAAAEQRFDEARELVKAGTSIGLTARERQVLELLAEGLTNRRIAEALFITEKTASVHVTHILAKLQVTNRCEAGAVARGHGKAPADGEVTQAIDPFRTRQS